MTVRRSDIFDPEISGVYHCMSRCVRKEPLLASPQRRDWLVDRIERLAEGMAIDVIAFAVMSNHMHLLLRNRPDVVRSWSDHEVARRRIALLPNRRRRIRNRTNPDSAPSDQEIAALIASPRLLRRARRELSDLGFFHRLLKEPCARAWNREDGVTGHFWEGRFLSPPVLDGASLLRVSRYIELNEIRACTAHTIRESAWTSAHRQWLRLRDAVAGFMGRTDDTCLRDALDQIAWEPVFPCGDGASHHVADEGPGASRPEWSLVDYLASLEFAGRTRHPAKPGFIRENGSVLADAIMGAARIAAPTCGSAITRLLQDVQDRLCSRGTSGPVDSESTPPSESAAAGSTALHRKEPRRGRFDRLFGSCHTSSPQAAATEALRRGVARVIPIPLIE